MAIFASNPIVFAAQREASDLVVKFGNGPFHLRMALGAVTVSEFSTHL